MHEEFYQESSLHYFWLLSDLFDGFSNFAKFHKKKKSVLYIEI